MKATTDKYLCDLNAAQRQAVEHGIVPGPHNNAGPLLVIAGAGSGKTKTIAHRVAHLIANGADPSRILLLTFTRKAADEMIHRVEFIVRTSLSISAMDITWAGTFHSVGARLLREYARQIGLKPSFTILDRSDAADLMNLVRHELGLSKTSSRFPKKDTCLDIYSFAVNSGEPIATILANRFPWCREWGQELRALFRRYVKEKQRQNVLDYDDLLLAWAKALDDDQLAANIGSKFDHVLVDEYQDTNWLQSKILLRLKPDGRGLMVVGDDAQSIYSFRAAIVRNILEFPKQFSPKARVVTLEQNYRSTQPILDACNGVISFAEERFTKNLFSERRSKKRPTLTTVEDEIAQARYVAQRVLKAREAGVPLKSQAILFRASHHSARLEIELAQRNIPFVKFGGLKFLEAAHVKDVLSVLRWAENPGDRVAGFRALQLLPGIGPSTATKVLDHIEGAKNVGKRLAATQVPTATAHDWPAFATMITRLRKAKAPWPAEFDLVRVWYEPHLERLYDHAHLRAADVEQMQQMAAGYRSRQQFLTDLTLEPPEATGGRGGRPLLDDDYLVLSTIHSAKGREWRNVWVLNVVDGSIPSDKATGSQAEIEEERRLLYVAMTRAKDRLGLIVPRRFFKPASRQPEHGRMYMAMSRFIPESIRHLFEQRSWHDPNAARSGSPDRPSRSLDIGQALDNMWRH